MAANQKSSTITGDVKSRIDKIWDTLLVASRYL